jgi:flagellin
MQTAHNIMQRMRELAVQSSNGTNDSTVDRKALELEFSQLNSEISQIANTIKFNDMQIFDKTFTIQSGANATDITTFSVSTLGMIQLGGTNGITFGEDFDEDNQIRIDDGDNNTDTAGVNARNAINAMTSAINMLSSNRAQLGAIQNRLEFKIQNLDNSAENLAAAESRIRDVDMAKMMTDFTKNNILFQASTAMLAQANTIPQGVLQLLG